MVSVAILAIGNEVVEGQIVNRNAAWLSEQLEPLGFDVRFHLSCKDRHSDIATTLSFLESQVSIILVTGGLGPTKDDCTRENLAQWSGQPLEVFEDQWILIQNKLRSRNVTIREMHKKQALIPRGSYILPNSTGVAPGFILKKGKALLAALPGPPSELQPMFDHLKKSLLQEYNPKQEHKLVTWLCLGAPESELAFIVESMVGSHYEVGFRLYKPFVEIKIWVPVNIDPHRDPLICSVREKIAPWWVADSVQYLRQKLKEKLKNYSRVYVIDHLSRGLCLNLLNESNCGENVRYQAFEKQSQSFLKENDVEAILRHMPQNSSELVFALLPASEKSVWFATHTQRELLNLPRSISIESSLGIAMILEMAFLSLKKV